MKKIRNYILISVCGILALSSVLMTIETATSSMEVAKLEDQKKQLTEERRTLEEGLVKNISVAGLQEKSLDMGFTKPTNLVYVAGNEQVAKLP